MERRIAEELNVICRNITRELDSSVRLVMDGSNQEEFCRYRRIAGKLMGEILLEILQPIYSEYPDLTPRELRPEWK